MKPTLEPFGLFLIPTYWLIMSLACSLAFLFFYSRVLKSNLSPKIASEVSLIVLFCGLLGARLFHVLFEYPDYYFERPLEVLKFWSGGFVFYGGFSFGALSGIVFLKYRKQAISRWLDAAIPALSLGYILGRIGCLFAGCCYGRECFLPWAITFPQGVEAPPFIRLHPTQVYSALLEGVILLVLLWIEKRGLFKNKKAGLFSLWMVLHGFMRIFVEYFRGDFRGFDLYGISFSSIFSILLIALGALLLQKTPPKESTSSFF